MRQGIGMVLDQHGVVPTDELLDGLAEYLEGCVEQAWLDNEQALALIPTVSNLNSMGGYLAKHRVRRRSSVQRTSDVLAAIAKGDGRRRRERED